MYTLLVLHALQERLSLVAICRASRGVATFLHALQEIIRLAVWLQFLSTSAVFYLILLLALQLLHAFRVRRLLGFTLQELTCWASITRSRNHSLLPLCKKTAFTIKILHLRHLALFVIAGWRQEGGCFCAQ